MAVTVSGPDAVGVMLTEQVPPDSVHEPLGVNVTVPVGVIGVPAAELSDTVTVHVVAWLITTVDGVQLTLTLLVLRLTVTVAVPVLVEWLVSPLYVAETVRVPAGADGVIVTEQVADDPEPDRVHVPPGVNVTGPVGVVAPDTDVSVTVAVQVVAWLITTVDGTQLTVVVVGCKTPMITVVVPWLPACTVSPP